MKKKLGCRFWTALLLFSLMGQIAWVVENMYFNVFLYKIFSASASDISLMVAASAVAATLTTVLIGALADRVGKRKLFICGGYILWGISILSFSLIRLDLIEAMIPATVSAASVGVNLVIVMDCVMTFFGSSANDAAFNAWLTDSTDPSNRGAAEGLNAMMPLCAILAVFGGFMSFDLNLAESWTTIFLIIGGVVLLIGIFGIFLIKEPPVTPDQSGYWRGVFYGFSPKTVKQLPGLYLFLGAFVLFNISIQIFMPYLIIYYEVSLGMSNYVLIMAPAIVLASAVTALWGRVYDKKGFRFSALICLAWLILGYGILYICRSTLPVFLGSLLMMSGYLSGMAVFGAVIRDKTPTGKAGRLQGVRIFSQVLLPGIIGPFIGKLILSNADTVVGNDGTESFIPSANIFLGATVPALLLLVAIGFLSGKQPPKINQLQTPYEVGEPPFSEYPRPTLRRDSYINLNGLWHLTVLDRKGSPVYDGSILVPFPPESHLSGVERITAPDETLVYERSFEAKPSKGRLMLHFGASDNDTEVSLNGKVVGHHRGGYLPFSLELTDALQEGTNTLTVTVKDPLDHIDPYGKQTHRRGGMWYTPVSGIWQTVWLEEVPSIYMEALKITPTLSSVTLEVMGGEQEKLLILHGKEIPFTGKQITLEIEDPKHWSPEQPYLYRFTLISGSDRVESYFALRTISIDRSGKQAVLTLNGKPYFFHGLLDQGYYPDGIFLPPSEQGFADDILRMKELGFQMLRKHIKLEPEIFYYYCDLYGMVVFQDMVNNGSYSFLYDTALPTLGFKRLPRRQPKRVRDAFYETATGTLSHLYNHPSVVYYTIFNEGWGQHDPKTAYKTLKTLDPTRIFDTASGWFRTPFTDVQSEHVYFKRVAFKPDPTKPIILSEFGGYSCSLPGHAFNSDKVYGYKICKDPHALTQDLAALYRREILPLVRQGMSAAVLTQVSDVEEETNGILTYDRRVVKPDPDVMKQLAEELKQAFASRS